MNILFFCCLFLCIYLPFLYINQPLDLQVEETFIVVDIDDYESYQRLTLRKNLKKYHLYVYDHTYEIGDILWISGEITEYKAKTNPFGFDAKKYFLGHGIYGLIDVDDMRYVDHQFHINHIRESIMISADEKVSVYMHAFIFGERIKDESIKSVYENFNIIYLFTVSGIHIFMLVLFLRKIMFHLNINEQRQHAFIMILLMLLTVINQFHYAVLRVFLIYLLKIINKKYHGYLQHLDLICLTFFLMLMIDIHLIYHQGFLITFIILVAIELLHPLYQSYGFYSKHLFISIMITVLMVPFFLELHLLQILFMPFVIGIVIYVIYPLSIMGYFFSNFRMIFQHVIELFEFVILKLGAKQIGFYLPKFNIYHIFIYYGLFVWICFGKQTRQVILRIIFSIIFLISIFIYQIHTYEEQIVFLDVGQGDTTIVHTHTCKMVIDSFDGTLSHLKSRGIYHLDYLILTHSDEDHILEAVDIIEAINVDAVLISAYDQNYPQFKQQPIRVKAYDQLSCGSINMRVLGPLRAYEKDNNNSIVLKFKFDNNDFLFTGDIEIEAEQDLIKTYKNELKSNVIKVPHHGSITSSSDVFITYVNPSYAIFSLKTPNRYGFPADDVLSRYIRNHVIIYRTDIDGTITYSGKKRKEKWSVYLSI